MLIEQIIEFELRVPIGLWALVVYVFLKLVIFTKQKSPRQNHRLKYYLVYRRWQYIVLPMTWAKSLTKFNPKLQNLNVF